MLSSISLSAAGMLHLHLSPHPLGPPSPVSCPHRWRQIWPFLSVWCCKSHQCLMNWTYYWLCEEHVGVECGEENAELEARQQWHVFSSPLRPDKVQRGAIRVHQENLWYFVLYFSWHHIQSWDQDCSTVTQSITFLVENSKRWLT